MPDIFISYKQEERATASQLATRLTEAGYDVWWDAALLAGERFEDEIASVLGQSRAVIILWSRKAASSEWVKAEAETARAQQKALPAVIDDLPPDGLPLLYRGLHVVRLRDWQGDPDHPGYRELMKAVSERLGAAAGPVLSEPQAEQKLAQSVGEAEVWSAIVSSPDPNADEYRAYLRRFGPNGRFAELAQIRIQRLDAREREKDRPTTVAADPQRSRGRINWLPAIVLPVLALLLIAGAAAWLWLFGGMAIVNDMFVPADVKVAAARCESWSQDADHDWVTTLPTLADTTVADCEAAEKAYPGSGDAKARLAMARVVQGIDHADEGIALANRAIDLKSGLGSLVLGIMYEHGLSLGFDLPRAATYYRAAFDLGVLEAGARLCLMAIDHQGALPFAATKDDVYRYCLAAADANVALGQYAMGLLYEYGDLGIRVDDSRAASFYRKAADQGSIEARIALGSVDIRGVGVTHDSDEAFAYFQEAARAGYPAGLRWLGIAYERAIGVARDVPRAGQLLDQAYEHRDAVAALLIGFDPLDKTQSYIVDRELDRLAEDTGNAVGQRMMGQLLERGYLRNTDDAGAIAAYEKCAGDDAICQFVYGSYLKYGPMTVRDLDRAHALFHAAADAGEMHAQFEVGYMYETGIGEPHDVDRALDYYRLAAAQGSQPAASKIKQLSNASGNG